jgi:ABC-2 type transport system ATP-binding protein
VCIIARGSTVADGLIADVKQAHGSEYVAITLGEWSSAVVDGLRRLRQVVELREQGRSLEVRLHAGSDPQELLRQLVSQGVVVKRFEVTEPSLEQIFIERVGASRDELSDEPELTHV